MVNRFTQKLKYPKDLNQQALGDFLIDFKILSQKEITNLYYGKVYRVKNISPNQLILKTRRRGGSANHYIDCRYHKNSKTIIMEVKTSNAAAYFYILWPMILLFVLTVLGNTFNLSFSIAGGIQLVFYSILAILIGILSLMISINAVKNDLELEMYRLTGLRLDEL